MFVAIDPVSEEAVRSIQHPTSTVEVVGNEPISSDNSNSNSASNSARNRKKSNAPSDLEISPLLSSYLNRSDAPTAIGSGDNMNGRQEGGTGAEEVADHVPDTTTDGGVEMSAFPSTGSANNSTRRGGSNHRVTKPSFMAVVRQPNNDVSVGYTSQKVI